MRLAVTPALERWTPAAGLVCGGVTPASTAVTPPRPFGWPRSPRRNLCCDTLHQLTACYVTCSALHACSRLHRRQPRGDPPMAPPITKRGTRRRLPYPHTPDLGRRAHVYIVDCESE